MEMGTPQQVLALRERRMDAGFAALPVEDPTLVVRPLLSESLVAALPARHPLAAKRAISLAELAGEPFVMCPRLRLTGFHEVVLEVCRGAGFAPRVAQEAGDKRTLMAMVGAGFGVAIVPRSARQFQAPEVVFRPFDPPLPEVEVAAIWHRERMSPPLRILLDVALEVFRQPPDDADLWLPASDALPSTR
jgi:DNA-binding transcriptional LysR family regulator